MIEMHCLKNFFFPNIFKFVGAVKKNYKYRQQYCMET